MFGCCSGLHVHQISRQQKVSGPWLPSDWLVTIRHSLRLMSGDIVLKLHGFLSQYMTSNFCLTYRKIRRITRTFNTKIRTKFTDNLVALHFKYDQARRRFVEWAQNEIAVVPDFHKRILFSDEAHFWLNGYVNKQNWGIWSEANPQVYVETPLHPQKLTVWCALWAGGILLQKR
ncbi:uncharacterized protein TNCV_3847151 [Trichonephila clavipes]|nr:uncharacterized protein TNCV_3847151 [Trichonephila clavipes]